ncbi:MAG: BadF/BadG/BcrA/BcrD ATPase family protein [Candidatus Acidiferrum sp.]
MPFFVGVDVGSISAKLAALYFPDGSSCDLSTLLCECAFSRAGQDSEGRIGLPFLLSKYRRTAGNPLQVVNELLGNLASCLPEVNIRGIRVTGSGARLVAEALDAHAENEFKAVARATRQLYPDVRTVFEIGGESSKYLRLAEDGGRLHTTGSDAGTFATGIADYSTSGECAAGTGSFLDQQASRLKYRVEEIGDIVAQAKCAARIAGRCSVFAKSDMIHAQQEGYSTHEVLKGLCEAVARNFKSSIVRGKTVNPALPL